MILTYKYRIKDKNARKTLRRHAIAVNQVWNYCNAYQKDIESRYKAGSAKRKWPSHFDFTYLTKGCSKELEINSGSISEVCRGFVESRTAARRSVKFRASFGPKRSLGWIPFRGGDRQVKGINSVNYCGKEYHVFGWKRRPIPENAKGGCFVEDSRGRWFVTFRCEVNTSLANSAGAIGIDLGLKTFATCSNGEIVPSANYFRKQEKTLAVAQRAGNKARAKAIHAKIANCRRDHLHKASAKIARENSLIVVGDVSASQLKQTKMAKSVSDAGWYLFKTMLRYKASRHGATFIEADERFTSRTCSECGSISGPKGIAGLGIRHWECSDCGSSHDRDVNAAKNILRVGLSTQARADESRRDAAGLQIWISAAAIRASSFRPRGLV